jgi:WD40 repeat protein
LSKLPILVWLFVASAGLAQQQNFREVELPGNPYYLCSIELSPDGTTLAIGTAEGNLLFWDIHSQTVTRKYVLAGFEHGPYMRYSADGRYLLLMEQYFTDWALNKDRPSRAAVIDAATGTVLLTREKVNAAHLTPDSRSLVTLEGNEILFRNIEADKAEKRFSPPNISNSFGISTDGKMIVVAQRPTVDDLSVIPSLRNDKKAIKEAMKYREVAVAYDINDFRQRYVVNDIMDIIFSMRFTADGETLLLFNAPNTKFRASGGSFRNAYVQAVNPLNGEVTRTLFATNAPEPIYKESRNGYYVGVTSVEHQRTVANSVLIFDRASGQTLKRFKNDFRLFENIVIGRACFEFMPDEKTIALGYGNRLVLWNFTQ